MASDDLLSEGEIDALMESVDDAAASADAADDGQYRRFDFGGREHALLREFVALESLMERHADSLANTLDNTYSLEFTVRPAPPRLLSVRDALAALARAAAITTTTLEPLHGPVFIVLPGAFLSFVVNAYFGGGKAGAGGAERPVLTPTELRVAERIAELQLRCLCAAWIDKLPLEAGELSTLGSPDRIEMLPASDLLLRLRVTLVVQEEELALDILLPFLELEPYRERFAPPKKKDLGITGDSWEPFFRRELPSIEIEIAGVLTSRQITLAELLQLAEGSVIPLPSPEHVRLVADDMTLAEGRYGSFSGNKAVQLERLASVLAAAGK